MRWKPRSFNVNAFKSAPSSHIQSEKLNTTACINNECIYLTVEKAEYQSNYKTLKKKPNIKIDIVKPYVIMYVLYFKNEKECKTNAFLKCSRSVYFSGRSKSKTRI